VPFAPPPPVSIPSPNKWGREDGGDFGKSNLNPFRFFFFLAHILIFLKSFKEKSLLSLPILTGKGFQPSHLFGLGVEVFPPSRVEAGSKKA